MHQTHPIERVFHICNEIMAHAKHALVFEPGVDCLAEQIKGVKFKPIGYPKALEFCPDEFKVQSLVRYEMTAASINYCYWYGRDVIRPTGGGANTMYELLDRAWNRGEQDFREGLITERFPLVEARLRHLDEVYSDNGLAYASRLSRAILDQQNGTQSSYNQTLDWFFTELLLVCPGFADDILLKRASLFFMLLYRRIGAFKNDIHKLPIPADYQVPKMLKHLGCLLYTEALEGKVRNEVPIMSGSAEECEIRAASILACQQIAERAGITMCDVDEYLWTRRKECKDPFHLTWTTHY